MLKKRLDDILRIFSMARNIKHLAMLQNSLLWLFEDVGTL